MWVRTSGFESMLPEATEARRLSRSSSAVQSSLDVHAKPAERTVSYSDTIFKQAALEWLIATDQVIICFVVVLKISN